MTRTTKRIAGLGLLALAATTPAFADATLTISDGTNDYTVSDGGTGVIVFDSQTASPAWLTSGGWILDVDIATTEPLVGGVQSPDMHLSVAATGQGTLNVTFSDPDFIGNGTDELITTDFGGDIGGGSGSGNTVSVSSGSSSGPLASFGPLGPGGVDGSVAQYPTFTGPYTLDLTVSLDNAEYATSSLDAAVATPEPGTLALLGVGLLGCVLIIRRPRVPIWQRARILRRGAHRG